MSLATASGALLVLSSLLLAAAAREIRSGELTVLLLVTQTGHAARNDTAITDASFTLFHAVTPGIVRPLVATLQQLCFTIGRSAFSAFFKTD